MNITLDLFWRYIYHACSSFAEAKYLILLSWKQLRSTKVAIPSRVKQCATSGAWHTLYHPKVNEGFFSSPQVVIECRSAVFQGSKWSLLDTAPILIGNTMFTLRQFFLSLHCFILLIYVFQITNSTHMLQCTVITRLQYDWETARSLIESNQLLERFRHVMSVPHISPLSSSVFRIIFEKYTI